jgi:hypothetical protein
MKNQSSTDLRKASLGGNYYCVMEKNDSLGIGSLEVKSSAYQCMRFLWESAGRSVRRATLICIVCTWWPADGAAAAASCAFSQCIFESAKELN